MHTDHHRFFQAVQASKHVVLLRLRHSCVSVDAVHGGHDASFLIFPHTFFEEVGLPLQTDHLHPVEWVRTWNARSFCGIWRSMSWFAHEKTAGCSSPQKCYLHVLQYALLLYPWIKASFWLVSASRNCGRSWDGSRKPRADPPQIRCTAPSVPGNARWFCWNWWDMWWSKIRKTVQRILFHFLVFGCSKFPGTECWKPFQWKLNEIKLSFDHCSLLNFWVCGFDFGPYLSSIQQILSIDTAHVSTNPDFETQNTNNNKPVGSITMLIWIFE